jgi:hypothetical protein
MHAVFRESTYPDGYSVADSPEFTEFQRAHAGLAGYVGTVVAHVGGGRHLTVTLWETEDAMRAAREAIGPAVQRFLGAVMTAPAVLLGTGPVVVNDLAPR